MLVRICLEKGRRGPAFQLWSPMNKTWKTWSLVIVAVILALVAFGGSKPRSLSPSEALAILTAVMMLFLATRADHRGAVYDSDPPPKPVPMPPLSGVGPSEAFTATFLREPAHATTRHEIAALSHPRPLKENRP